MSIKPWKVLGTNYFRPRFRIDTCELPNGNLLDATIFEFRSWANVLALTKNGEVVLVQQYRHGVCEALWEFPGGVLEDDEDPGEGARRELLEETGYAVSKLIPVGKLYPNPAIQTNALYCFLALEAEKVAEQELDSGEDIEVKLVPLEQVIEMARRGEFTHALNTAVLFQALLHLDRIQ